MRLAEAFAIEGIALNILFATDNSVVFPFFFFAISELLFIFAPSLVLASASDLRVERAH